jgi:hypothetical protein
VLGGVRHHLRIHLPVGEELLRFLSDEIRAIEGITDVDTSTVLDIAKFGYEWELREEDVAPNKRARSA